MWVHVNAPICNCMHLWKKTRMLHELRYWSCWGVENDQRHRLPCLIVTSRYFNALICICVQFSKNCISYGYCRWLIVSVKNDNAPCILPWIEICRHWNAPVCTCMHFSKKFKFFMNWGICRAELWKMKKHHYLPRSLWLPGISMHLYPLVCNFQKTAFHMDIFAGWL